MLYDDTGTNVKTGDDVAIKLVSKCVLFEYKTSKNIELFQNFYQLNISSFLQLFLQLFLEYFNPQFVITNIIKPIGTYKNKIPIIILRDQNLQNSEWWR